MDSEDWPEELRGIRLGALVQGKANYHYHLHLGCYHHHHHISIIISFSLGIRENNKLIYGHPDRKELLNSIDFPWEDMNSRLVYSKNKFQLIYEALIVYKSIYNDLYVPQTFIVPSAEPWPESLWDLKLGARINAIRSQGTFISNSPERR